MSVSSNLILRYAVRPVSARALEAQLKLTESTVRYHIKCLRNAGLLRICDWVRGRTQITPLYQVGSEPDAPKPPPVSKAELNKRYRARNPHVTFFKKASPWDPLMRKI